MVKSNELKGRIVAKGLAQYEVAKMLEISPHSLVLKIDNRREFRPSEITKLAEILDIDDIRDIFFAKGE